MKTCAIIVEGPTEEAFVNSILAPRTQARGLSLTPIVVPTKHTPTKVFRGGGGKWSAYRDLAASLLSQPHWAAVAIMFDVYGRPSDTPGGNPTLTGKALQRSVRDAIEEDLSKVKGGRGRIVAGPVLHEFETLVLAAAATGSTSAPRGVVEGAKRAIQQAGSVEGVNDGQNTSPSKRLARWWPQYQKVIDGPALIQEIPFETILEACPTFDEWLQRLLHVAKENEH